MYTLWHDLVCVGMRDTPCGMIMCVSVLTRRQTDRQTDRQTYCAWASMSVCEWVMCPVIVSSVFPSIREKTIGCSWFLRGHSHVRTLFDHC